MTHASIHGRFQPFHNAHLAYALAALKHVEHVYIGLSRVLTERGLGDGVVPHRFDSGENPLTYFERTQLVKEIFLAAGISQDRFTVGPFPIENIGRLPEFWPKHLPCFTTNVSNWNEMKIATLKTAGFQVKVLHLQQEANFKSGTEIRLLARSGNLEWRNYVPASSISFLENIPAFGAPPTQNTD